MIEIYSLTKNKNRKCFASNKHFADFVGLKENTIQKMMLKFENAGYIKRIYEYKENSKEIDKRIVVLTDKFYDSFINEKETSPEPSENPMDKNQWGYGFEARECGGEKSIGDMDKKSEVSNTSFKSNNDLSDTNNNALKDVKRSSFKGNIYDPFPREKGGRGEQSRFIPADYTYEQLREHIKKPVTDYAKSEYENDSKAELITNIVVMFYRKYEQIFGNKHPVLSDKAYGRIVDRYFDPPEVMYDYDDLETYETMADRYFTVNFNQQGRYDGEITKSLSHFMSAAIRENLFLQTCR